MMKTGCAAKFANASRKQAFSSAGSMPEVGKFSRNAIFGLPEAVFIEK